MNAEALQSLRYVHDKLLARHISRDTSLAVEIREATDALAARLQEAERERDAYSETLTRVGHEHKKQHQRANAAEARETALREALSEIIYGSSIGTLHKARQIARAALAADPESKEAPE
jgi:hypothetical protein